MGGSELRLPLILLLPLVVPLLPVVRGGFRPGACSRAQQPVVPGPDVMTTAGMHAHGAPAGEDRTRGA